MFFSPATYRNFEYCVGFSRMRKNSELELDLELIQIQMAQNHMLREEE